MNDPAGTHSGIWLPVTIEQGKIYTLSADVDLTSEGDWISLGYAQYSPDNAFWASSGYGTVAVKPSWVDAWTGVNTHGNQTEFANAGSGDYANIQYIGFTKQSNATGKINNIKFSQTPAPETSQFGLITAVIAALVVCSVRRYRETS